MDITTNLNIPDKPANLIQSSSILGYTYDDKAYTLDVWYKGKASPIYRYFLVYPITQAQIFNSGGSAGAKASKLLKGFRSAKLK